MASLITGGCFCGFIRYECSAEPILAANCHCRDCQRTSGGGFAPILFVPYSSVSISGEVKYFVVKGESGQIVSRGFCTTCGSQLFSKAVILHDMLGIRAGTLDDPSQYVPRFDFFTSSAQPWDCMNPDLPKFPHMPPT